MAGRAVDVVVVVGPDPERLAAAEPVLAGWTKAPAAAAGAENRRCGTRRPGEVRAIEAAVARGDLAALEVYRGINGALGRLRDLSAAEAGNVGAGPAITSGRTWRSTRVPE